MPLLLTTAYVIIQNNIHNDKPIKDGMEIENDFQDKKIDKADPGQNDITKDNNNSIHIKYLGKSTSLKTKILNIEDILYLEVKDVIKIHEDDKYIECFQCNKEINIKLKDISKLNSRNIKVYRQCESSTGNILLTSDGKNIKIKMNK